MKRPQPLGKGQARGTGRGRKASKVRAAAAPRGSGRGAWRTASPTSRVLVRDGEGSRRQGGEPRAGGREGREWGAERRGDGKRQVAPETMHRSVGELCGCPAPREGQPGESLGRISSSWSSAWRAEAAPFCRAASSSLTAVPGALFRGWAQAIRGSSGSRSSSSPSRLSPPAAARLPDPGDSAMASSVLSALTRAQRGEVSGSGLGIAGKTGQLGQTEATSLARRRAWVPPTGCPAPPRPPPAAPRAQRPAPAPKSRGVGGRGTASDSTPPPVSELRGRLVGQVGAALRGPLGSELGYSEYPRRSISASLYCRCLSY